MSRISDADFFELVAIFLGIGSECAACKKAQRPNVSPSGRHLAKQPM
jgi:hypothetical protein